MTGLSGGRVERLGNGAALRPARDTNRMPGARLTGLVAAILVSVIGISATHLNLGTDILTAQGPTVIKAGGPVVITEQARSIIR